MKRKWEKTPHNYTTVKHTKKGFPYLDPLTAYYYQQVVTVFFSRTFESNGEQPYIYIYMQKKKEINWSLVLLIPENFMEFSSLYGKCRCKLQSLVCNVLNSSPMKGCQKAMLRVWHWWSDLHPSFQPVDCADDRDNMHSFLPYFSLVNLPAGGDQQLSQTQRKTSSFFLF